MPTPVLQDNKRRLPRPDKLCDIQLWHDQLQVCGRSSLPIPRASSYTMLCWSRAGSTRRRSPSSTPPARRRVASPTAPTAPGGVRGARLGRCRDSSGRDGWHLPAQLLGVWRCLPRRHAGRRDPDDAEPHLSRARGPLSARGCGCGRAHQRRHTAHRHQPERIAGTAQVYTVRAPGPSGSQQFDSLLRIAVKREPAHAREQTRDRRWRRFPSPAAPPACPRA